MTTALPSDLFPSILQNLTRAQLQQCSLVNSYMQQAAQNLLFSFFTFCDSTRIAKRNFFLSQRGRELAHHVRFITLSLSHFHAESLADLSDLLSLMHRVVSLKVEGSTAFYFRNWNASEPDLWDILFSKVGLDLQILAVEDVGRRPLQDVLRRLPSLRRLELGSDDSGYIVDLYEELAETSSIGSQLKSLSLQRYCKDGHPRLASFLRHTVYCQTVDDLKFGYIRPDSPLIFQPLYSLCQTLCHLSFDTNLCVAVSRALDPELLPLSALSRLQTLTLGAWLPGIGSAPPKSPGLTTVVMTPCVSTDKAYPFYMWVSRLILEEGLPPSFTTFRFSVQIYGEPREFVRHQELDELARCGIHANVEISFEFDCRYGLGYAKAVEVVEHYLPSWKELGKLKMRVVETYSYCNDEIHWEPLTGYLQEPSRWDTRQAIEEGKGFELDETSENESPSPLSKPKNPLGRIKRFFFS